MFDDITYFDGAYYDGKYHTVIKPSSVEIQGDYFEEGYITDNYIQEQPPAVFSLEAVPISYQSRFDSNNLRPFDIEFDRLTAFDNTIKKYGTHSLEIGYTGYAISEVINQDDFSFPPTAFEINADSSFCFEGWFYIEANPIDMVVNIEPLLWSIGLNSADSMGIDDMDELSSSSSLCIAVGVDPGSGNPGTYAPIAVVNSQSGFTRMVGSYTMAPDTWYHIALTRDTSGNLDLRINNSSSATATNSGRIVNTTSERLKFANNFNTTVTNDPDKVYVDSFIASYNDDTVRGYNSSPNGGEYDIVYYRFDNDGNDDTSILFDVDATLASTASLSCSASTAVGGIVDLDATFTITSSSNVLKSGTADIDSTVSISADAIRIQNTSATLNASTSTSATGIKIVSADSSNDSSFGITADSTRILFGTSDFDSIGSVVAAIGKVAPFFANVDIQTSLTVDGAVKVEGAATIDSDFTVSPQSTRNRTTDSTISTTTTIANTARRLRTAATQLDSNASISANAFNLKPFGVALDTEFGTNISANVITNTSANLSSEINITGQGALLVDASANISNIITISVNGLIVNLVQYVYTIPTETRLNTVESETRLHSVRSESREHSVSTESRLFSIRAEDRIHEVEGT